MEETKAGHRPRVTREELESKHLAELHELAAASGVPRYRLMRRAELIDALAAASGPPKDEAALNAEPAPVPAGLGAPQHEFERDDQDAWGWESLEAPAEAEEEAEAEGELPAEPVREDAGAEICAGVLDLVPDGYGFLRVAGLGRSPEDVYVSRTQVRRLDLRRGDELTGSAHPPRRSEQYPALVRVDAVNGVPVDELDPARPEFEALTPIGAGERLELPYDPSDLGPRMADLLAPIGKGQRGLLAARPGAGATRLLRELARAISGTDVVPIVVLLDARLEEVGEWQRSVDIPIHASPPESSADAQVQIAQLALERAKRLAEQGIDVVLLLDSLTRLARAHALSRARSRRGRAEAEDGNRDEPSAVQSAKRFFSTGRNTEEYGSVTMLCTVRAGSGSNMEEMVYDALSDSANFELRLRRELALGGLWPALDPCHSHSRSEEAILSLDELEGLRELRSGLAALEPPDAWRALAERIRATGSNRDLLLAAGRER